MAVAEDDNEVDGNGVTSDDDGYVSYNNTVKLIILLIFYSIIFTAKGCCRRESKHREGHGSAQCRITFEGAGSILLRRAVVAASL
jgi:hypothetical protein